VLSKEEEAYIFVTILGKDTCPLSAQQVIAKRFEEIAPINQDDRVIKLADLGITALHYGALQEARATLEETISIIGATLIDKKSLDTALALSGSEKAKIFKGEAHERALCYFYRGLIYMAEGDYENARACFISGEMQTDRFNEEKAIAGYWLSLKYLQSLMSYLCSYAQEMDLPKEIPEGLSYGVFNKEHDTIIIVASGFAPLKVQEELKPKEYGLSYRPVISQVHAVKVKNINDAVDNKIPDTLSDSDGEKEIFFLDQPTEDIYVQALSRGRRDMDKVLEAKKRYAQASVTRSDVSQAVAQVASQCGIYGLPVALVSSLFSISGREGAAKVDSIADLRQLNSIPGKIFIGTLKSSNNPILVEILDEQNNVIGYKKVLVPSSGEKMNIVLVRVYK
jgi:tetratricopeptide (TPR) repeat protein